MIYNDPTEVIIAIKRLLEFAEKYRFDGRDGRQMAQLDESVKRLIEKVLGSTPL